MDNEIENHNNVKISKDNNGMRFYIKLGGMLFLICSLTAVLIAVIYGITKDKIAENELASAKEAILSEDGVFSGADSMKELDKSGIKLAPSVIKLYEIKTGEELTGYCFELESSGFGGNIDMIVGTDIYGDVVGVRIVSLSETPGLGSRVQGDGFLSQFEGKSESLTVGDNIDAIAGATISSKAVTAGVNDVLTTTGLFAVKEAQQ